VEPSGAPWRVIESSEPSPAAVVATTPSRTLTWPAIGVAVVAVAAAVAALLVTSQAAPSVGVEGAIDLPGDAGAALVSVEPATELVVDVGGAVQRPGLYRLPAGSRVADAIEAAGGYGAGVDAAAVDARLNLAAPLSDGEQVRVPVRGEATPVPAGAGSGDGTGDSGAAAGPIDVNTASAEALDTLPGVGPATAAKIIAAREEQPFASIDDLLARKVVGPATLEKLRPLITTGP
jgi:competence protein ComEA